MLSFKPFNFFENNPSNDLSPSVSHDIIKSFVARSC